MRVSTIYPAIQGEGCNTGIPMVIVRLQGCDVGCPWCDTKETWDPLGGREMSVGEVVAEIQELTSGHRWVLVTGGEPAIQDLAPLVDALHVADFRVALETSGTRPWTGDFDWVCVSPKEGVQSELMALADEVKYVVVDKIPEPDFDGPVICLQPVSQGSRATQLCIEAVQERGWRLSIQLHKYLNLP